MNGLISKVLPKSKDVILKTLADDFLNRHIWKYMDDTKENEQAILDIKNSFNPDELKYYTAHHTVSNSAYQDDRMNFGEEIQILLKDGSISTLKEQSSIIKGLILTGVKEDPKFFYRKK